MHELLILSKQADAYLRRIRESDPPDLKMTATRSPDEGAACGTTCDIAFGEPSLIAEIITRLPNLRWVQSTWAGVEPLLLPGLRRDYVLTNARGVFGEDMAEYVFAYLLANERRILQRHSAQCVGRWDATPSGTLAGKTIGLMGVGSIGAVLARTAKYFGMRVKGYTRTSEACLDVDVYHHGKAWAAFAADIDYLVNVLPNTADTYRIVNAEILSCLPSRAIFINVGRGSAVDEAALADVLQNGRLAGAVLDVFEEEPLPEGHIFWRTPNVLITSHTAALSVPEGITPIFLDNYRRLLRGEPLRYRVDFDRGY